MILRPSFSSALPALTPIFMLKAAPASTNRVTHLQFPCCSLLKGLGASHFSESTKNRKQADPEAAHLESSVSFRASHLQDGFFKAFIFTRSQVELDTVIHLLSS